MRVPTDEEGSPRIATTWGATIKVAPFLPAALFDRPTAVPRMTRQRTPDEDRRRRDRIRRPGRRLMPGGDRQQRHLRRHRREEDRPAERRRDPDLRAGPRA